MAKLLGTAPNQAPTNADLGDLAYQDGANAVIGPITVSAGQVPNLNFYSSFPFVSLQESDAASTHQVTRIASDSGNVRFQTLQEDGTSFVSNDYLMDKDASGATSHAWRIAGAGALYLDGTGLGIDTTSPTQKLDVNDDSIRVRTAKTPSSASDTGTTGQIAWDADYIYVCTATDTWKRVAIATW